jgi:large subunit ribosomal protein L21
MVYAIIQVGGMQYRAEEGAVLQVPLQRVEQGQTMDISDVLLVNTGESSLIGTPFVEGAKVEAEVVSHGKQPRIRVYKYKRRTKYRRTRGHRQEFTEIKVNKIMTP